MSISLKRHDKVSGTQRSSYSFALRRHAAIHPACALDRPHRGQGQVERRGLQHRLHPARLGLARGRGRGLLGAGRRELANTATLNIVGASVALTGAYWEDDPSPGEVSEVFVEGGNSQEAREAMAAGLRPLVSYLRRLKRALTYNCNCHHHVKIPRC